MSNAEVKVVRRSIESLLSGDIETALSLLDPQIVWHGTIGGLAEGRTYHGHEEVIAGFIENNEPWEEHRLEPRRYVDAGESVVVLFHEVARSRHSDVELENDSGVVYRVAGGLIVEVQGYLDPAAALSAAGVQ